LDLGGRLGAVNAMPRSCGGAGDRMKDKRIEIGIVMTYWRARLSLGRKAARIEVGVFVDDLPQNIVMGRDDLTNGI
jgi:hypothetical protein